MSATTRPPSPSLASLSDTSGSDIESLSSADVLSTKGDEAPAASGNDATANADGTQDSRFFKGEGLVTFMVEGTSYRVHEYLLTMHSSYWARELEVEKKLGENIELEGVAARDMDALMRIFYHKSFQGYDLTDFEEWQSVLRLAAKWECTSICALAINQLEPLASPLQKLVMARAFGVTDWLRPALVSLCVRKEPLTLYEGKQLSMEDVISINSTREATRQKTQVVADESEVDAYIVKHVLPANFAPSAASDSTLPETTKATDTAAPSPPSVTTTQPIPAVSAPAPVSASTVPSTHILSATPSMDDLNYLVTALLKKDFDLAVSLVTLDNVQVFVDALTDFTKAHSERSRSANLVDAILRRGAKDALFIPVGIKLLRSLAQRIPFSVGGWDVDLNSFLLQLVKDTMPAHRYVMSIRARFDNISLALRYADDNLKHDYALLLKILGGKDLTTSLYDERSTNLQSFYKQLIEARMLASNALD